ncbi:hypothetical protein DFS33DRAFT_1271251 [Desarmillaria ectypa]|nr:hypothetical protein DFS33DRAFT_1271251 [Desarmillaria ectypa]
MWTSEFDDLNKIFFGLDFVPDPIHKARFESAIFWVTFGRDDGEQDHLPLNISTLSPANALDTIAASPDESVLSIDDDSWNSCSSEGSVHQGTATKIHAQGLHSPTATWSFGGGTGRGLEASYTLSVVLPTTTRVWMEFWAKAVLIRGDTMLLDPRHKITLETGTKDKPYQRILDLSIAIERTGSLDQQDSSSI